MAIAEDGGLVMFEAYGPEPFGELAADWARVLAGAMGTTVVPRGIIRPRLAPEWYDDGSRDYAGSLRFLSDDAWVAQHVDDTPEAFVQAVEAALPGGLHPGVLHAVLRGRILVEQPHLMTGLLPRLEPPLAFETALQVGRLLIADGQPERAWALAGAAVPAALGPDLRRGRMADGDRPLVRLWIDQDPVRALRALRHDPARSRVTDDLWAEALEALGRSTQPARIRGR